MIYDCDRDMIYDDDRNEMIMIIMMTQWLVLAPLASMIYDDDRNEMIMIIMMTKWLVLAPLASMNSTLSLSDRFAMLDIVVPRANDTAVNAFPYTRSSGHKTGP